MKHGKDIDQLLCANCGAPDSEEARVKPCSRCETIFYCGKACQRQHWKSHKPNCIAFAERTPAVVAAWAEEPLHSLDTLTHKKCLFCLGLISSATMSTLPCKHSFHKGCLAKNTRHQCIVCKEAYMTIDEVMAQKASPAHIKQLLRHVACTIEAIRIADRVKNEAAEDDDEPVAPLKFNELPLAARRLHAQDIRVVEKYTLDLLSAVNLGSVAAAAEYASVLSGCWIEDIDRYVDKMAWTVLECDTSFELTPYAMQHICRCYADDEYNNAVYDDCMRRVAISIPEDKVRKVYDYFYGAVRRWPDPPDDRAFREKELSLRCIKILYTALLEHAPKPQHLLVLADTLCNLGRLYKRFHSKLSLQHFQEAAFRYEEVLRGRIKEKSVVMNMITSLEEAGQTKRVKVYARMLAELNA